MKSYVETAQEVAWKMSSDEDEFYRAFAGLLTAKVQELEALRPEARGITIPFDLWDEIHDFIYNQVDVIDGADGPRPNRAMHLFQRIEELPSNSQIGGQAPEGADIARDAARWRKAWELGLIRDGFDGLSLIDSYLSEPQPKTDANGKPIITVEWPHG